MVDNQRGQKKSGSGTLDHVVRPTQPQNDDAHRLLEWLLDTWVVLPEEWDELPALARGEINESAGPSELLENLIHNHLLTKFQAELVRSGRWDELILGHYRILEILGRGGMGVVYRGEHLYLRRQVAIKVTTQMAEENPRLLHRFYAEARAVAKLRHPNIVACLDSGRPPKTDPNKPAHDYFVMEYLPGQDLHHLVRGTGPLPIHRAAGLFRQIADALIEAHRNGLVHRDIKPSNILVTPDWQAKLLDFGLALQPNWQVTEPGVLLGTVGYMAPEQAEDPHSVDGRADLFSLGASLFCAVTGRDPFPESGNPFSDLNRRISARPPDIQVYRPELPQDFAALIQKLLEPDPEDRFPSAEALAAALVPFTKWSPPMSTHHSAGGATIRKTKTLVLANDGSLRTYLEALLGVEFEVRSAKSHEDVMSGLQRNPFALLVIDVSPSSPPVNQLLTDIRAQSPDPDLKILLVARDMPTETLGGFLMCGADDFLTHPFTPAEFRSRVRALINKRESKQQSTINEIQKGVGASTAASTPAIPIGHPWDLMTETVAGIMVEAGFLTSGFRNRMVRYIRALASMTNPVGEYERLHDQAYINALTACAPLYDIGLLALPGGLPLKPGKLDPDERIVMETHVGLGAGIIQGLAASYPSENTNITIATELIRSHHERWDGKGYPEQVTGTDIPLSARVVALVSIYDAMRCRRPYRPALNHNQAIRNILLENDGRYDPALLTALHVAASQFDQIYTKHSK